MLSNFPWRTRKSSRLVTKDPSFLRFNKSGLLKSYFLVFLLKKSISVMFTKQKTYLSPSIFNGKLFFYECMYAWLCYKNWKHGVRLKSIMLESRVSAPYGRDYGFNCTCIMGSTKFPKSLTPFRYYWITGLTPGPTTCVRKSHLSVVTRVN
jgi:hypothetical protein